MEELQSSDLIDSLSPKTNQMKHKILLVDDTAEDCFLYRRYLQQDTRHDYDFYEFSMGEEALVWCQDHWPDVILLDYLLPDMEGLEFLNRLKLQSQRPELPIIAVTGQGNELIAVQLMKSGVQDYLLKGKLTREALQRAVHTLIERIRFREELEWQQQQQQLVSSIALRIRQSLELEMILQTTVEEVRNLLQTDRVLVYQFDPDWRGEIIAESVENGWTPTMGQQIQDTCFQNGVGREIYVQGNKRAIADIYSAGLKTCHIQLLEQFEVKANLVVPILLPKTDHPQGEPPSALWGLLIAHHCRGTRNWTDSQLNLLDQIGVQLAIAIQQAELYQTAQRELEERRRIEVQLRQSEAALQESEQRLRSIVDGAPFPIFIKNLQGQYIFINRFCENLTGFEETELLGKTDDELFPSEIAELFRQGDQQALKAGEPITVEEVFTIRGETQAKLATKFPLFNLAGEPYAICGLSIDISNVYHELRLRKQAEIALQESQQRYASLAMAAPVGIFRTDAEGRCVYVNEGWSEMTGMTLEEARGYGWSQALHPEDCPMIQAEWYRCATDNIPFRLEYRFQRLTDGKVTWVYGQAVAEHNIDGEITGYVGTITDITPRKEAETQLQTTNAELARATRLKDEFLANMSHELRTPLNAILGLAEGLQEEVYGNLNSNQKRALSTIERSGKHLLELINEILDLSKIESGKFELNLSSVQVKSLCDFCLIFVRQEALKKEIKLLMEIPISLPCLIADEKRLRQVLINLLSNAVKFTPQGGQVTLRVKEQPIEAEKLLKSNFLIFEIEDTGIGIAEKNLDQLFQSFVQLDSRLNRQYQGTGLGLALVKRITELHGGFVTVSSKQGQGSCFTVRLPYQIEQESCVYSPASLMDNSFRESSNLPNSSPHQNTVILIAEDNQTNIDMLSDYLESYGHKILIAYNGHEAIKLTTTEKPNLILMDIQMPELDGLEAIRQIKANPELKHIPIIALTALAMPGDQEKCIEAGADYYLTKPVRLKLLAETIKEILPDESQKYASGVKVN